MKTTMKTTLIRTFISILCICLSLCLWAASSLAGTVELPPTPGDNSKVQIPFVVLPPMPPGHPFVPQVELPPMPPTLAETNRDLNLLETLKSNQFRDNQETKRATFQNKQQALEMRINQLSRKTIAIPNTHYNNMIRSLLTK